MAALLHFVLFQAIVIRGQDKVEAEHLIAFTRRFGEPTKQIWGKQLQQH